MLAAMGGEPSWRTGGPAREPAEEQIGMLQQERHEARQRMLDLMGGPDKLQQGPGSMFGIVADDEDYGYGRRRRPDRAPEIDLATGKVLAQDGVTAWKDRPYDWARKADASNPNPPRMPDTITAPGQAAARAAAAANQEENEFF